ncbi:hypothetical protein HMI55_005426 [Coelomomyces lativittatus]|nr:hypothetical protein HMI55_005426 [Coelomomyces lativittatus]
MKWLLVYFSTRSFFLVWLFSLCFSFILTDNEEAKPEIPHSLIDTIIGAQISNSRECMPVNAKSSVPGGRDASLERT